MDARKQAVDALGKPLTANEELQRATVRHAVRIERLKEGELRRVQRFLNETLYPDLLGMLTARLERIKARGFDPGPQRTQRVKDLHSAVEDLVSEQVRAAHLIVRNGLFEIGKAEAAWQAGTLVSVLPVGLDVVLPATQTLRSIVTARPFQGRLLKEWYGGIEATLKRKTRDAIAIGIAEGQGTAVIARRVRKAVGGTRRGVEAITRTAVNHTTTHARHVTYQANSDIISGWIFSATLDSNTTFECAGLDGTEWPLGSGPLPPRDIGCRSADIPKLKSWKELGFDVKDTALATRRKYDGKVPGTFTFEDFLRGESPKFQREYLGRGRFEAWRTGKLGVDDLTDNQGFTLNLGQLQRREPEAFAAAAKLRTIG